MAVVLAEVSTSRGMTVGSVRTGSDFIQTGGSTRPAATYLAAILSRWIM